MSGAGNLRKYQKSQKAFLRSEERFQERSLEKGGRAATRLAQPTQENGAHSGNWSRVLLKVNKGRRFPPSGCDTPEGAVSAYTVSSPSRLRRSKIARRVGSPKILKTTVGSTLLALRFINFVNLASISAKNALQRRVKSACVRLFMLPMASFTTDFAKGYSSGLPLVAEGPVVSI